MTNMSTYCDLRVLHLIAFQEDSRNNMVCFRAYFFHHSILSKVTEVMKNYTCVIRELSTYASSLVSISNYHSLGRFDHWARLAAWLLQKCVDIDAN